MWGILSLSEGDTMLRRGKNTTLGAAALIALGSTLLASLVPTSALAQDEAARTHFESGRLHYENGDYERALEAFEAAYELSGRAALRFNLYLTEERLGHLPSAIAHLEGYLADGEVDEARRAQLNRRLTSMRARAAAAEEAGGPTQSTASAGGGGGDLVPAAIAFGVAGAGLAVFGIFGGLALAADGDLASGCGATRSCSDAQLSDLASFSLAADIGWISASVAAAAGVVLLVTLGLDSGEESSAWVRPSLSPERVGLNTGGSF